MPTSHVIAFVGRAVRLARTKLAVLGALLVITLGVVTFVELADAMTETNGQAFDQGVMAMLRP